MSTHEGDFVAPRMIGMSGRVSITEPSTAPVRPRFSRGSKEMLETRDFDEDFHRISDAQGVAKSELRGRPRRIQQSAFDRRLGHDGQGLGTGGRLSSPLRRAAETRAAAIGYAGLGGVLCFDFDNIRYVTATHIGEWARDKFFRYALCPAEGKPFLWDPAPPAKRISSPWISDNVAAPITTMQGAIPPSMNMQHDFAKRIKKALVHMTSTGRRSAST